MILAPKANRLVPGLRDLSVENHSNQYRHLFKCQERPASRCPPFGVNSRWPESGRITCRATQEHASFKGEVSRAFPG